MNSDGTVVYDESEKLEYEEREPIRFILHKTWKTENKFRTNEQRGFS